MARRALPAVLTLLTLIWGTLLFAGAGVTQRPFYGAFVLALTRHALAMAAAAGVLLAGLGFGSAAARGLRLRGTAGELWLAAALTGTGSVGAAWLWMALARVPSPVVTMALLAAGWAALWRWHFPLPPLPRLSRPVWAFVLATLGLSLLHALHPASSFDALLYHLRLPELWMAERTVYPTPREPPFYFPVLSEALFAAAMQLGGESAAQLVHWGMLPLVLLLTWQLFRRVMSNPPVGMLWTVALSIQMLPLLASWAYTDLFLACFQLGVVWALLMWRDSRSPGWLVAAGLCAGFALGIKYLAIFTPALAAVMIAVAGRRSPASTARGLALFGTMTAVAALPSYLRAFIASGNPIFPFLFPSPYWDEFRSVWYAAAGTGIGFSLPDLLALPFTVVTGQGDANYFDARPGVVVLTFAPLALLLWAWKGWRLRARDGGGKDEITGRREWSGMGWLLFFAGAYGLIWVYGVVNSAALRQGRFLLSTLLLLCPMVAWAIGRLGRFDTAAFRPSFVARFFVAAGAAFTLLVASAEFVSGDPAGALFGDRAAWQARRWGPYAELAAATRELPADARVLLWYEPRSYTMPVSVHPDTVVVQFAWRLRDAGGDLDRVDQQLCNEGYGHVAIYQRGAAFLLRDSVANPITQADYDSLQRWAARHERVWEDEEGWYEMYRVGCDGR